MTKRLFKSLFTHLFAALLLIWIGLVPGAAQAFSGMSGAPSTSLTTTINGVTLTFTDDGGDQVLFDDPYVLSLGGTGRLVVTFSVPVTISEISYYMAGGDGFSVQAYAPGGSSLTHITNSSAAFTDLNLSDARSLAALVNVQKLEFYHYNGDNNTNSIALSDIQFSVYDPAPSVNTVSVPAIGTYGTGQNLDFTVNFDENVTVNTAGGTPNIALTIGSTTRYASYTSGSGTSALVFRYTIQSGDSDSNGITVGALSTNGGTLQDSAAQNASLTLNAVGSTTSVRVSTQDSDGGLGSASTVIEPVALPTTADTVGEAVDLMDFTLTDGGTLDGSAMTVSQVALNVSGTASSGTLGKITWRLTGPDAAGVTGTYSAGTGTITFSGLSISVANGGSEIYKISGYFNDNSGLTDGDTIILSVDGDSDLSVGSSGTLMGSTSAVTNGLGTTVEVSASALAFTTQPSGSVSGAALTTQPVVKATDAFDNVDTDFTEVITLTEASAGTLTGNTATAVAGVATFSGLTYTATADQQSFTLTANDEDGVGSNLGTTDANGVTSDVVATKLVFDTQPAPLSVQSGQNTTLTTVPVISARDANDIVDTGYSTNIGLSEVNGAGSAIFSVPGDTDAIPATVSMVPSSGVVTLTGMALTYTVSGSSAETFNLRAASGALSTATSSQFTATVQPTVTNVSSSTANGSYKAGDTISIQVTFNQTVNVTGTPQLSLETGSSDAVLDYASGTGTNTLTFTYMVSAGHQTADLDYIATSSLTLNGGTIRNATLDDALLTLPTPGAAGSLAANKALIVDTSAPSLEITAAASALKAGETTVVTFSFDEDPIGFADEDITVTNGTLSTITVNGSDPSIYTATFTPTTSTEATATISVSGTSYSDLAGNTGGSDSLSLTVDTLAPTVAITTDASGALTAGTTTLVTFTFSEAPTGFANSDLTVVTGTLSTVTVNGSNPKVYTATFTPTANTEGSGAVLVNASSYTDAAGNTGGTAGENIPIDTKAPSMTISASALSVAVGETATVTFTFSEVPTGFADADISATYGSLSAIIVDGSDSKIYRATFTPDTGVSGTATISVAAGSYTDAAGNEGAMDTHLIGVETEVPTLTISSAAGTVSDGQTTLVTFTFSHEPTGFADADISVSTGSLSAIVVSGTDPKVYTATYTPPSATTVTATIAVADSSYQDSASNDGLGDSLDISVDAEAPTLSITADVSSLGASDTATVSFTFSEAPDGFADSDVVATNGTLSSIAVDGSDSALYTATFTPSTDFEGSATISVADGTYTDGSGNDGDGASLSLTLDTLAPTVTITSADSAIATGGSTEVTFTFSETPSGFSSADISVTNGSLAGLASGSNPAIYTATFTPLDDTTGTAAISVGSGTYTDAFGNAGSAESLDLDIDTAPPTVTIAAQSDTLGAGETLMISFTFSSLPEDFSEADIWADSGTLSAIIHDSVDPLVYWARYTPDDTTNGDVTIGVTGQSYRDDAGNWGTGDTMEISVDSSQPTLAITADLAALAAGQTATITFTFSEAPVGFADEDIRVSAGSLSAIAAGADSTIYTATYTPAEGASGRARIRVRAGSYTDAAGNEGARAVLRLSVDTVAPGVTISGPEGTVADNFAISITFTEAVSGFTADDITVSNGLVQDGSFAGSGTSYSATIVPQQGTEVSVSIAAQVAEDEGGNANTASNVLTLTARSPETAMEERQEQVQTVLETSLNQNMRNHLAANVRLTRDASTRFIQSRQLMSGRALRFAGQTYIPFKVMGTLDATQGNVTGDGRFLQQVGTDDGRWRRVFFGDFDLQARDDEQVKLSLNARVAWEHMLSDKTMVGYFFGGSADRSNLSGEFTGTLGGIEANLGAYAIHSLSENLFLDGFASVGIGKTRMSMSDDVLDLTGEFWTNTATIGAALTGTVGFERFDFWPEISATYARSVRPDTVVTGRAYGVTDHNLKLEGDTVSVATIKLRPQIRLPVMSGQGTNLNSVLTFAPTLTCERLITDQTTDLCGNGMEMGLSSVSRDGNSFVDVRLNVDRNDENVQRGIRVAVEHRF